MIMYMQLNRKTFWQIYTHTYQNKYVCIHTHTLKHVCEKIKASFCFLPFVLQLTKPSTIPLYCNHTSRLHRTKQFVLQSSQLNSEEERKQNNPEEVLLWKHFSKQRHNWFKEQNPIHIQVFDFYDDIKKNCHTQLSIGMILYTLGCSLQFLRPHISLSSRHSAQGLTPPRQCGT